MKLLNRRLLSGIAAVAAAAALMVPSAAFAQGGPGNGHGNGGGRGGGAGGGRGNGGGGGPGEEAIANNLSVPAIFVPSTTGAPALNFACGDPVDPTGAPQTGFAVPGYYYLQGVDKWQGSCATATDNTVSVTANWGDNLVGGEAALKTGSPIRVEMGLLDAAPPTTMTGYDVVKLEPSELDRVSPYGTAAESGAVNAAPAAKTAPYLNADGVTEVRVWDYGATLKIYNTATPTAPIFDGAATAEINATGRVVYGYNLRVPTAGTYTIEFTAPTVSITSANTGNVSADGHTVSLTITVGSGGGGGGGH